MESRATGPSWAIATPHTLATEAGAVAYDRGGNALDAALWAATTLAVTYPHMCGTGGDLFALVRQESGQTVAINASGRAPAGIDVDVVREAAGGGPDMPERGPFTVTVPGAVSGWEALHGQGCALPWTDAFTQAVALAHGGVSVAPALARSLDAAPELAKDPGMAQVFFLEGAALEQGALLRQPALGATLHAIAQGGADVLYRGEVGRTYADGLRAAGVPIDATDLTAHRAELGTALRGRYRDLDVLVAPPNSQGFVLLEVLGVLERMGVDPDPLGPDAPTLAMIMRAAAFDRDRHLADPEAMRIHISTLLEDGHQAILSDEVRAGLLDGVHPPSPRGGGDTIALVTADASGRTVSLIQSLSDGFGAGILEPATGIMAHSRGGCFTMEPGHPNELAPGRRSLHTLMPVLVQRDGMPVATAGTMGGFAQPQINAMTLIRAFDLGMSPADAVGAPRWLANGMDREGDEPSVTAEADVPAAVRGALEDTGFRVDTVGERDGAVGHAHLIRMTPDGFEAGSDPRADGGALAG